MQFHSDEHKRRFNDLCERDKTNIKDVERRSLFYIFSGAELLHRNIEMLYNFEDHTIRLEAYNEAFLSGGTRSLVDLAFSLYGSDAECEIRYLFNTLDDRNSILALQAIKYRFQILVEIVDLK
ncbi:hypothetical protein J7E78_01370 [Paenibacillus polymyxa]|uniref:DUF6075 family protein n=1 Tax=Paenibacillus polymyxa TaxID=1406 RepID=UPI001BE57FDB|nr:DUF6075 family protein [Paenibacillus polymyxa]MBT2282202.1 hypothetical protein [Paenibacillus polymyxa]